MAQQILQDRVDGYLTLNTSVVTTSNIESNVGRDNQMEIEETPGSSLFPFKPIKFSAMDTFVDSVEGNGDEVFQSFEIFDNPNEFGVDLMKR